MNCYSRSATIPNSGGAPAGLASSALDAAFADLPDLLSRIDEAQTGSSGNRYVAETQQLVATIGEQLQSLQQQRARLMRLLEGFEPKEQ